MKSIVTGAFLVLLAVAALWAQGTGGAKSGKETEVTSSAVAIEKGAQWLVSVQGANGGWGQDGGETSYVRSGERLESGGNDVANTAVAALALLQAGKKYQPNVERALDFILKNVEASTADGLEITNQKGTQIQRKLGPYIDTFLTSMLLAEVDGTLSKDLNARVRGALEKCVAKIEHNQQKDGSWNLAGGWAPILGTSMASRSLFEAGRKGVKVEDVVMRRAEDYTVMALNAPSGVGVGGVGTGVGTGVGAGIGPGVGGGAGGGTFSAAAGVPLYQKAQALEQLSRTEADRVKNAGQILKIQSDLADAKFVDGFGSIGGEEFFSYLNVSDGLQRGGGAQWKQWHAQTVQKILICRTVMEPGRATIALPDVSR